MENSVPIKYLVLVVLGQRGVISEVKVDCFVSQRKKENS